MSDGNRPETGYVKFGRDWRGVFVRGDTAGRLAAELRREGYRPDWSDRAAETLPGLLALLEGSNEARPATVQRLRPWSQCRP